MNAITRKKHQAAKNLSKLQKSLTHKQILGLRDANHVPMLRYDDLSKGSAPVLVTTNALRDEQNAM